MEQNPGTGPDKHYATFCHIASIYLHIPGYLSAKSKVQL